MNTGVKGVKRACQVIKTFYIYNDILIALLSIFEQSLVNY